MQDVDFKNVHIPGKQNIVADALSRQPDLKVLAMTQATLHHHLAKQIRQSLEQDEEFQPIIKTLQGQPVKPPIPATLLKHYSLQNGLLLYDQTRTCIPKCPLRTQILHDHHDIPTAGHQGIERTYAAVHDLFYWPRMNNEVRQYVKTCDSCQRIKASQQSPAGLLQPLPVPTKAWEQVSMDFITQLPNTKAGHDAIVVFVDTFSKMVHFAPTKTTATAPETAKLFFEYIFRSHGLPKSIVSNRDAKFTSKFWQTLCKTLGTKLAMSTAFHPQTDGQTERANRTLADMSRAVVIYQQDDRDAHLAAAQ